MREEMKRYSLAGFSLAIALMIILQASAPTRAQQIYSSPYTPVVGFDFEDGTVQGWQILYNGVNGSASLSNSTQQAYHGSHALALATTDYNFGGSYALIGVGNTVISPSLTAHLYMVSNDEPEPHPGIVTACFVITDSANRAYSGNQITLPFRQWMTLTASRPLTFTAPYTLAVGINYYNVRPTVRTTWLDYVQWDDQPASTPTLPPTSTPTPTHTPTSCNPFGYAPWNIAAPALQSVAYPASASSNQYVYVAGGYLNNGVDTNQFSRYDPLANQWTALTAMPGLNSTATAAYDPSGNKVYVFGGLRFNPQTVYTHTRIYDAAANSWSYGPPLPEGRYFMAAGYWNGKIYLVGGSGSQEPPPLNATWEYDIATSTFITKTSFPTSHIERTSATVINGHLYIAGGVDESGVPGSNLYDYDIQQDTWTARAPMPHANYDAGSSNINARFWVSGGAINPTETLIYDPATDHWSSGPALNHSHLGHGSGSVGAYAVAVAGLDGLGWTNITEVSYNIFTACTPTPTYTGTPPTVTPTLTATPSPTCSPNVCGPLNPTLAVGTVTTSSISLHATANFDIGTFSFYRSTTGGPFVYVGSAFGHYGEFTDTGLDCATTYSYYAHVQEYGGYQRQGDSNIVTATTASCAGTPIATNTFAPSSTPTNTPNPTYTPTTTVTTTPTDCPNPFVDISGNVFYIAIHYLNCRGVISGSNPTHYSPAGTATRGQFAKIVVLGFGLQLYTPTGGTQDFTDVPSSYFAYTYIETGLYYGVLSGFDQPNCAAHNAQYPCYLPNIPITRGQLTKLVVNAAHYPLYTPTNGQTFSDVPPTNVFYASIETAAHKGVIAGYPDGTFHPNNDIRRDEMAQIVYKGVTTP